MPTIKKPAAKAKPTKTDGTGKTSFPDTRLQNTEPGHSKFWTIHLEKTSTTIHYGKIGEDPGRVSGPKDHKIRRKAEAFYTRQIRSKLKKGYYDVAANADADDTEPLAGKKRKVVAVAPKRKARKQDADPKQFVWGSSGGNSEILADGLVFVKGNGRETVGVRSKEPLPKRLVWSVSWSKLGSHQAVGVANATAPILFDGYGYVFGEDTEIGESWALCFNNSLSYFYVRHKGHEVEEFPSEVKLKPGVQVTQQQVEVVLRREDSKLFVQLPGSKDEHLIFSDLPDIDLFAVASTPYRTCQVIIQDPSNRRPVPDLTPPKPRPSFPEAPKPSPKPKVVKTYPECPVFDGSESKGSVREVMAGLEDGKWALELVEHTNLMWKHHGRFLEPTEKQKADVSFVRNHGLAFRDASSVEECFSERSCDDGVISCYKLKSAACGMSFTYYEGGFGGNSIGWCLVDEGDVTKFLASNCDSELSWEGPDKSSHTAKGFIKELRKIRYKD